MSLLEIRDLAKSFRGPAGPVKALGGVDLDVASGELVAVCGPSGCGKTTLLLIAGGLLAPDRGTVLVEGQDPYALGANARARLRAERIGYVFQQFHLIPYLGVRDNVLAAALAEGRTRECAERADHLLDRFGLASRAHHVPAQLSTGERQRTALARALLHEPRLILADEPTGNLDHENAREVLAILRELTRDGAGVLLVTHDERAATASDRRLEMRDGAWAEG